MIHMSLPALLLTVFRVIKCDGGSIMHGIHIHNILGKKHESFRGIIEAYARPLMAQKCHIPSACMSLVLVFSTSGKKKKKLGHPNLIPSQSNIYLPSRNPYKGRVK